MYQFGYSSAYRSSYSSSSYQIVMPKINASKASELERCRTRTNRFLGNGYIIVTNNCFGYLHFYMIWGWREIGDGWYGFNNCSNPNGTYQYAQDFTQNINP